MVLLAMQGLQTNFYIFIHVEYAIPLFFYDSSLVSTHMVVLH